MAGRTVVVAFGQVLAGLTRTLRACCPRCMRLRRFRDLALSLARFHRCHYGAVDRKIMIDKQERLANGNG